MKRGAGGAERESRERASGQVDETLTIEAHERRFTSERTDAPMLHTAADRASALRLFGVPGIYTASFSVVDTVSTFVARCDKRKPTVASWRNLSGSGRLTKRKEGKNERR